VPRSSRGHRQGGRGSSRCRCRAQGSVGRFGGGPGQHFTAAQRRQHDGVVPMKGAEEEKGCTWPGGGCAPFIDGEGESGETVGSAVAVAELWVAKLFGPCG
jgi:hypothetical protein